MNIGSIIFNDESKADASELKGLAHIRFEEIKAGHDILIAKSREIVDLICSFRVEG